MRRGAAVRHRFARGAVEGKRARFYSVVDLVNQLDAEKRAGRAGYLANRLLNQDAIVLDELGYLPFSADGGALANSGASVGLSAVTLVFNCDSSASLVVGSLVKIIG